MSIRIRTVNGRVIAICAARSIAVPGDIYLDDASHTALGDKFSRDYNEMYGYDLPCRDTNLDLVNQEESNNPNREWWDKEYPGVPRPISDPVLVLKTALTEALAEIKEHNANYHHFTWTALIEKWEKLCLN